LNARPPSAYGLEASPFNSQWTIPNPHISTLAWRTNRFLGTARLPGANAQGGMQGFDSIRSPAPQS